MNGLGEMPSHSLGFFPSAPSPEGTRLERRMCITVGAAPEGDVPMDRNIPTPPEGGTRPKPFPFVGSQCL